MPACSKSQHLPPWSRVWDTITIIMINKTCTPQFAIGGSAKNAHSLSITAKFQDSENLETRGLSKRQNNECWTSKAWSLPSISTSTFSVVLETSLNPKEAAPCTSASSSGDSAYGALSWKSQVAKTLPDTGPLHEDPLSAQLCCIQPNSAETGTHLSDLDPSTKKSYVNKAHSLLNILQLTSLFDSACSSSLSYAIVCGSPFKVA